MSPCLPAPRSATEPTWHSRLRHRCMLSDLTHYVEISITAALAEGHCKWVTDQVVDLYVDVCAEHMIDDTLTNLP
jgi:hypothetical protein